MEDTKRRRTVSGARRAGSWLAAVLAPVAVLGLGALAGAPKAVADAPAAPARATQQPARQVEGSDEIALADGLRLWNRPAHMSLFWTVDKPEEVVRTYADAWNAAGFLAQTTSLDRVSTVSFVDPQTGLLRSVTALPQDGQTLVIPAVTDVRSLPDPSPRSAPVPVPENAAGFLAHGADEPGVVSWSGSFVVALAPERALAFYRKELGSLGYAERTDDVLRKVRESAAAAFSRGPEDITVVATRTEEPRSDGKLASFVMVTHVRTLPPPEEP